jgi:hypothetical protein
MNNPNIEHSYDNNYYYNFDDFEKKSLALWEQINQSEKLVQSENEWLVQVYKDLSKNK